MPFYEYECGNCGVHKEVLQKMSDPVLTNCTDCGQPALTKLVSRTSFQLKGGGWYATDFRGDKKTPAAKNQSSTAAETTAAETTSASTTE